MNKILVVSILITIIFTVSITAVSAQNQYNIPSWVKGVSGFWAEGKITDAEFGEGLTFLIDNEIIKVPKIKQLQDENTRLQSENTKLKNDIVKLKTENSQLKPKQNPIQSTSELSSGYPSIDKRYSGIEAKEKIKELFNFHNSMTVPQRLVQISKPVSDSDFIFVIIFDGEWRMTSYNRNNTSTYDKGTGVTVIPFDCSHNRNYYENSVIQKIDEYDVITGIIFKNGVAVGTGSTEKPYGMAGIFAFCDTGVDANNTYLKTLS